MKNAKEQLKGNFLLGLENTASLMSYAGKSECLWGKIETFDEVLNQIEAIDEEKIEQVIENVFCKNKKSSVVVCKQNEVEL